MSPDCCFPLALKDCSESLDIVESLGGVLEGVPFGDSVILLGDLNINLRCGGAGMLDQLFIILKEF